MLIKLNQYRINIENKLLIFLGAACIFFISIKGWIESFNLIKISNFTYLIYLLFGLLCLINFKNIKNYGLYLISTNIRSIDFLLVLSLLLFFIIQGSINFYALTFLSLYLFVSSIATSKEFYRDYRYLLLSLFVAALITVFGIFIGVFENLFFETKIFHNNKVMDYPNPISIKYHFSGFQFSYNYSAYIIISGLGITHLILPRSPATNIFRYIFFVGLFLTQAKAALLYIAIMVVMSIQNKLFSSFRNYLLGILLLFYLILCHFTFATSNSEISSVYYFREIKFSILDINVYSTLFLWLKEVFVSYIISNSPSEVSISGFQLFSEGLEPHSILLSSYLFGGFLFSALILLKIFKVFYEFFMSTWHVDKYFLSLVMVFMAESFVWDAYDSPIFWIIILLCPLYKIYFDNADKNSLKT